MSNKKKTEENKWFQAGAFEDGWQWGDLNTAAEATMADLRGNLISSLLEIGEGVVDTGASIVGSIGGLYSRKFKEKVGKFVEKDLYDSDEIAKVIVNYTTPISWNRAAMMDESNSVLGEKADSLAQSTGQLLGTVALQSVGVPWWLTTGASTFGAEMQNALQQGATYDQATFSALVSAGAEILSEKLSGGISFGGKTLDDGLTNLLAANISSKTLQKVLKFATDATGEGLEEVFSNAISAIGQKLSYDKDKDVSFKQLFMSEEAFDNFIGGFVLGGGSNVIGNKTAKAEGKDAVTGLKTDTEKKVVDKIFNDTVAEKEKGGEKLSANQRTKLYGQIVDQLESGDIDVSDVESILGEDVASEIDKNASEEELKKQMSEKVFERVKGTKLMNSYVDEARRGESFQADINEYDEAERATIQSAIDAGFLNNTNKTRRFINFIAKVAARIGVKVDFTNNDLLKKSSLSIEGRNIDAYVTGSGRMGINMQSSKILESLVGHEMTHIIQKTSPELFAEMQKVLYDFADSRGELSSKRDAIAAIYEGIEEDIESELTAELVAEYLFTDSNFVNRIASDNRNLFQKMWDEVKYMWGQAHPSSKEAAKLAKLKRVFEDALKDTEQKRGYTVNGNPYKIVDGVAVSTEVADAMEGDEYSKPDDYMQYSVSTTEAWKKSYLEQNKGDKAQRVVEAIETFTNNMVQDDAVRGYVPMGEYEYDKSGPIRKNQEYIVTFDMDTSCPRTFQFLKYRDLIQKAAGRYLTYNESVNLLELMRAYGLQIPCCYCYVENKRVLLSASYNNFFKFRNDVLTAKTTEEAEKAMYGYNKKKGLPEASRKAFERWRSDPSYNPSLVDVWTATNTARNSVLNFLDAELQAGNINGKTAKSALNRMVLGNFGVTDKAAIAEIESFVNDWAYDTSAKIPHIYNTDNNVDISEVDQRALALNHEALAYAKSSSSAKSVENYVPYTDQLKNISEEDRKYILGMGGIRKHSSNDFRVDYVQDYFLFYADLAAGKWTGHTYTKSADFVRIFACTKDRINMSVAFYEDANGNIRENLAEGAAFKDVKELRAAYKNVGAMAMVTSDNQLSFALNADWIDMIIPFHSSGLKKEVWYNLRMWNDYTSKQLEKFYNAKTMKQKLKQAGVTVPSNAKASEVKALFDETFKIKRVYGEDGKAIKPHFLPGDTYVNGQLIPGHHNDVNKYLELCEQYGVHPRFYGVKVKDSNGVEMDVTEHPNYLKLIKETARTDSAQEPIEFNFDKYDDNLKMTPFEYAMQRLQQEAKNGGFKNTGEDPYGVVKEFIEEYLDKDRPLGYLTERAKTTRDILLEMSNESQAKQRKIVDDEKKVFSLSKSKTDADYIDAVNRGDTETAQRMVDEAAKKAGYTIRAYHGTNAVFNVFDAGKLGEKNFMASSAYKGFFAAKSRETAESYTGLNSADYAFAMLNSEAQASMEKIKSKYNFEQAKNEYDAAKELFFEEYKNAHGYKEAVTDVVDRIIEMKPDIDRKKLKDFVHHLEYDWNAEDSGDGKRNVNRMNAEFNETEASKAFEELNRSIYDEWEQSEIARRGYTPNVKNLYLKMERPFVHDFKNEGRDVDFTDLIDEAKAKECDGCIFQNVQDGADFDDIYVVFENTQLKSADPVTYDDNGNIIPLSKRFKNDNQDIRFSLSEDTEATPRDVYFSRIDEVYDKLKGKSSGKPHMVDGYNFFLHRNDFDESAYISITTPKGEKLRQIIDGGNLWKNARLWHEAAKMVANNEHPNVAKATTQEEAGEYSEIEGKREETKKTFKEKVSDAKTLGRKAVGYLVDKYQPIENLALKTGNRELDAKANSMRTAGRAAQHFIGKGADGVRAINDLRQEVETSGLENEFEEYMYDLLTTDRMSLEDRARPVIKKLGDKFKKLRVSQIEAIAKKEITKKTSEKEAQTIRDAKEYLRAIRTRNKPVRGDFYTADIARAHASELEQKYPQFKQWAEGIYANTNFMLDKLVADGELSQEAADRFRELYPHYVPIRRVNREGKAIDVPLYSNKTGVDAPVKGATGGDGTIGYLFETLAMRAEQTFLAGAKNRFGIELKNTLKAKTTDAEVDVEDIFDEVDTHEERLKAGEDGQAPTFTVFENGKRVTFEIPEDIYEALKPTPESLKGTVPVLSAISKWQRNVLTEYNPGFVLRNFVKDTQDAFINSRHARETFQSYPEAFKQLYAYAKGKGDMHWAEEYLANGGESLTYFDGKEKLFDSKNTKNPWAEVDAATWKKVIGFVPAKISEASNFIERVPRLAEYIASRKAGASIDVAMLDAARVTTNFAAGGDVTKWANRNGATFLNASVQGAAQAVRNVREAKAQGMQGMLKLGAKVALAGIPYLILNALLWGDDDEYEELSDYIKENYYIVAKYGDGQFVRIPKGRMAAVIQSAFQQMSNLVTGDDEVDFKRFGELMWENIAPNNPLENNVFAPIKNALENKTWYGDDLVPQRLQDLPAGEQSDETTDAISKWLGETFNVSPYKLNYLLDQYSGVFGDVLLPYATPQAEGGNSSILGGAIAPLADQFTTDSTMKNQNVSDFYDTLDDLTASAKSKYATDEDVLRYRYMNTINSEMSNLYKKKREIQNSDLPNRAKYEAVREVQRQIDELAKEALASYNDMYIGRNSATVGGITYKKNSKGEWQKVSESKSNKLWSDETLDKFIQEYKLTKVNWD